MPTPELLLALAGFAGRHGSSFAVLAASSWVFGETLLAGRLAGRPAERWPLAGALGLGLIAQAMFVLGMLGLFERPIVWGLLASGHLACRRTWRAAVDGWTPPAPRTALISGLVLLTLGPLFVLASYPPTGFDATVYHLPYARAFVDAGRLLFLPDLRFPVFPQVGEMGFVLGFFLSGEVAAKLTQLLAVLWTAGLLLHWGRQLFSREVGWWAAALWLGTPLAVWLGTSAYVDATLTLFVTAALYSWQRWAGTEDRRWLGLAGAFAGLAAGTKYLGLFFVAALALWTAWRAGQRRDVRMVLVFSAVALAVLAPWYLRIVYYTGNPVFPFYAPIFGTSEWHTLHDRTLQGAASPQAVDAWGVLRLQASRILGGIGFLLAVPWTAVFDRGMFHGQAPLSPFYLVLLPLCAPFALWAARTRGLMVLVAAYGLFWLTTVRDLRFLVAAAPALDVALAATIGRWTASPAATAFFGRRRLFTVMMTVALISPGWLYAAYKIHQQGAVPLTPEGRDAYLTRRVPGYEALRTIQRVEGTEYSVYALYGENLRYYADGRFLGDWFGPVRFSRVKAVLGDGRALYDELRSLGACYLLVRRPRPQALVPHDAFAREYLELRAAGDDFALYRLRDVPCSAD